MGKARTRNAREDKKDKLAAGLKLSHKAKRQMKKALVSKEVEEARGSGKAPSAHAILRAQGIPEAKAKLGTSGGGNAVVAPSGEGKRKKKKKAAPKSKLGSGVPEGGYSKCKGGHDLGLMRTPHDEYMCDGCDSGFQKKGALLFGCRVCDWDACSKCTAQAIITSELVREAAEEKAMREGKDKKEVSREGQWMWARKTDSYSNRFMSLRHTGTGIVAELHHYSVGQLTVRPGSGAKGYCIAETGEVLPFMLSFPDLEKELEEGGGKEFPEAQGMMLGNWKLTQDQQTKCIVGKTEAKEIKTTKHADREVSHINPKSIDSRGMEVHLLQHGTIVWLSSRRNNDQAVVIEPFAVPRPVSKEAALKAIVKG